MYRFRTLLNLNILAHISPKTNLKRDIEINHRIQIAYTKFATTANLLQNSKIHLKARVKFLNSFVRSGHTYSCQNWNLIVGQFEKLDVTYRNLLRRMIRGGFKRTGDNDGDFRYRLNNEKVHAICFTSEVSNFIRKQQKDYAGYVVRMPIERCEKQLMLNDDKHNRTGRVTLLPFWNNCRSLVIPLSIILLTIL